MPEEKFIAETNKVFYYLLLCHNTLSCFPILLLTHIRITIAMQDTQAAAIPAMVKNVVGKTCVFDVKINHYNTNLGYEEYTVIKLSESSTVDAHPIPVGSEPTTKRLSLIHI